MDKKNEKSIPHQNISDAVNMMANMPGFPAGELKKSFKVGNPRS